MAKYKSPTRGDWVSCCMKDLKYLNINLIFDNIKSMKKNEYKIFLQESIKNEAFEYLLNKQGSKGKEIKYSSLKMSEYLSPNLEELSISDKRYIFGIRNRMTQIENNFPNKLRKTPCVCGNEENQEHIYRCKIFNDKKPKVEYEENV